MEREAQAKTDDGVQVDMSTSPKIGVSRRAMLIGLAFAGTAGALASPALGSASSADAQTVDVWKSPTCGCCGGWVAYMRGKGYRVNVTLVDDPDSVKAAFGVPEALYSCHTAKIGDYLVEGHVPEAAIAKLMTERPKLKGVALPGMPQGAPGMDGVPGTYDVVSFDASGNVRHFMTLGV